jgi:hypothetical protein
MRAWCTASRKDRVNEPPDRVVAALNASDAVMDYSGRALIGRGAWGQFSASRTSMVLTLF